MSKIYLQDYAPKAQVCLHETQIDAPKFPVIDAHTHLSQEFGGGWCDRPVPELVEVLDRAHVMKLVDLDGGWGEHILNHRLEKFKAQAPDRFIFFGGVDFAAWEKHGNAFGEWAAKRLEAQVRRGAEGLKIWKQLGLNIRDAQGDRVPVDDPRLDPIWATAGALNIPVLVHVADPVAFFEPIDAANERFEELHAHPDWHFPSPPYPSFMTIMHQLARLIARHPDTRFIGAHVGCYAENLAWVGDLLDRCPNFYIDFSARIAELGRQPYSARDFFIKHQDRILFGTDTPASLAMYRLHYRFLETRDEYFPYALVTPPPQGRWRVYGLYLPDAVLEKVYHRNAQRVLNISID